MLPPLPVRQMVLRNAPQDPSRCISVMTFNILAQCYTRSDFFPSVNPKAALKWKNRSPKIVGNLLSPSCLYLCVRVRARAIKR